MKDHQFGSLVNLHTLGVYMHAGKAGAIVMRDSVESASSSRSLFSLFLSHKRKKYALRKNVYTCVEEQKLKNFK